MTGRADVEVSAFDERGLAPRVVDELQHVRGARAVAPSVRAVSTVVAAQQMFRVFLGKGRTRSRYDERKERQRQLELDSAVGGE